MAGPARSLMIQGTGSDVGKSLIVAGLCRAALRRGLTVLPFKPQNMSNNAAVTPDGGEIGRAQALQARAAGVDPDADFNPVLIKPQSDTGAQVVVQGRVWSAGNAREYQSRKAELMDRVLESFARVRARADLVIVEGAGSPAEINLRAGDIANMGFAVRAGVPVVLAADIDRGGVIASLVGTRAVLPPEDLARVRGFLINKFRGDLSLFEDGVVAIEARTGWRSFGVLPFLPAAARLPAEDAVVLEKPRDGTAGSFYRVAVPMLSRIANFDDLDPLRAEPGVEVRFVPPGQPIPAQTDLIVLPGTKATIADMRFLVSQSWDIDVRAHVRQGGHVLGLCGGYQMLGRRIADPNGVEGPAGDAVDGLGLLDVETILAPQKTLALTEAVCPPLGLSATGYEIHAGLTTGAGLARPFMEADGRTLGAASADGRIAGTYLHGLMAGDEFRRAYLAHVGAVSDPGLDFDAGVDAALDDLAQQMETHLDVAGLLALAE